MSASLRSAVHALRDFLRGFLGFSVATNTAGTCSDARAALAERAARRSSCC